MAFRRAPPGTPVPNPYDSQTDDETLGREEDEESEHEGDEEAAPRHMGFPCVADIAQVYLFFNIPCYICFCTTCVLSTFIPPTGAR